MPSNPEKRRTIPIILWASGLVALILVVVAVHYLTRERVEVRTAKVSYQDLIKTSSTNGNVEPIDDFQPHAQVAGVVEEVYVNVGDKVKPGQLLLKMDDADAKARLASAQSNLEAAQLALSDITHGGTQDERNTYAANLSSARLQRQQDAASLAALQQLQQKGAASAAEIAAAQQRLEVDDSSLHSIEQHSTQRYGDADRAGAQARVGDAQAALAAAQSSYASVNIKSPLAGTVYAIPIYQYDYVAAGVDLIYVADLNRIQVLAYFDEPEVGNLANGQPVKITWDAKQDRAWHGHISVAPTSIISYNTRNVGECIITVDDAHGDLQPNANVIVYVTTAQHSHALSVPREALHTDDANDYYVYRIIKDKLVRTSVQVTGGIVNNTRAEITGGLAEGDVVATTPTTPRDLTNGLEVIPVE
jgi:HlyD family secretion protein